MLRAVEHGPVTRLHMGRTFFGRPLYTVEAYWVDGLLIDTGCPGTAREVLDWCRQRGVQQAINTHHHEDHSGGDGALQRELGLPIAAPPGAVPILAHFPRLELYRRLVWGQPGDVSVEPLGDTVETDRYRFEVIPTPGHSPDHVCFFEPRQGWLFSGDLFIHERVRYLRADEDIGETLRSLRRVLERAPRTLFCAHAGVVEEASEALRRKIAYLETLRQEAQALQEQGLPVPEISRRLLGPEDRMARLTGGHFSKTNLVRALLRA